MRSLSLIGITVGWEW